jgi:hypothetical protein
MASADRPAGLCSWPMRVDRAQESAEGRKAPIREPQFPLVDAVLS